jgi:hypothetical protein
LTEENIDQIDKGILRRVTVPLAFSKLISNFKEANKKLIIV